ncbi:uncharacterized protein EDB91DRAFT_1065518, partial [Suillus paluster]|uniref:uncharacterized protein n=1 Tax=Suillus paluster TaxID=48578 RepID=UPI001B86ADFA
GRKCTIHWEGVCSACTEHLLAWCKENEDACIKLFSDSAKDAKEQGRKKKQSGTSRDIFYSQATQAVFSNDKDLEVLLRLSVIPFIFLFTLLHLCFFTLTPCHCVTLS